MQLTSTAFAANAKIPRRYTCEGEDRNPPLAWTDPPAGTQSLALICADPDAPDPAAPKMTWVHWVLVDIPPATRAIEEGQDLPAGARSGQNDWKRTGYGGPCPPVGRHRYIFDLYALDCLLPQPAQPTRAQLLAAIKGHELAHAQLIGTYQKGDA